MWDCKKERKRRIRKKIGKIKRDTEMRKIEKKRKEKRRWNLDADWARDDFDELSFAIVVIQLRWWRTRPPFYRHYQYLSASSFSRRGAKMCWLPSYWLYSSARLGYGLFSYPVCTSVVNYHHCTVCTGVAFFFDWRIPPEARRKTVASRSSGYSFCTLLFFVNNKHTQRFSSFCLYVYCIYIFSTI